MLVCQLELLLILIKPYEMHPHLVQKQLLGHIKYTPIHILVIIS